jgi:Family of unknown function (DUF6428)
MTCCASPVKITDSAAIQIQSPLLSATLKPVRLRYGDRELRAGFHVTEVKKHNVQSIDCGARQHDWLETTVQLLDTEGPEGARMQAGKLAGIFLKAGVDPAYAETKPIVFEIARPGEALQLFDFAGIQEHDDHVAVLVNNRQAVCKPGLVAKAETASACCGGAKTGSGACCA